MVHDRQPDPLKNSNLLAEMAFKQYSCAVNFARPSGTLRRISDNCADPLFRSYLFGACARPWNALLLLAGGNELIAAIGVDSSEPTLARRLLRISNEWDPESDGPTQYRSASSWRTFSDYLVAALPEMGAQRDFTNSLTGDKSMTLHTYAAPTARPAGVIGDRAWIHPPLVRYGILKSDWEALIMELFAWFRALRMSQRIVGALPNVHVFDTAGRVPLDGAPPGSSGPQGH